MTINASTLPSGLQPPPVVAEGQAPVARRRRLWILLVVSAVTFGALGVALATAVSSNSQLNTVPASTLGTFAGYDLLAPVRTVSAQWRVPKITLLNTSDASTWIGVQSPTGGFIQVGITEDSDPSSDVLNGNAAVDQGFWSDDTVEFHPQHVDDLGISDQRVRAGDLISASIAEAPSGWRLRLHDARSGLSFDQTIPMTTSDFNESEWCQEDPTNGHTNEPLPYPSLSSVVFTNVTVNGHRPMLGLTNAVWMSLPKRDFGVTGLRDDSFEVVPVDFNRAQARFLTARAPFEDAARRFDDVESAWRAYPPTQAVAVATLAPFAVAERQYDQTLLSGHWTGISSADVTALVKSNQLDLAALFALANAEPRPSPAILGQLTAAHAAKKAANNSLDAALHLPG